MCSSYLALGVPNCLAIIIFINYTPAINRVEDSEDFDDHILSSDEDDGPPIRTKPLDSRPPPRAGKKALPNFGVDAS
jgi:hypothetical protein